MNIHCARQVILDTETTGMNKFGCHYEGHRIIEIGAVEIVNRHLTDNKFHVYLNPHRSVDPEAFRIHGISDQFLIKQPDFADVVNDLLMFIRGSELIIHNAQFDLGFLNNEFKKTYLYDKVVQSYCTITDSLKIARKMFPGQRNSLDALCERFCINNSQRVLHNALTDAQLLAYVFLFMTGGQTQINFAETDNSNMRHIETDSMMTLNKSHVMNIDKKKLKIIYADENEQLEHNRSLDFIERLNKNCLWKRFDKKNVK